MALYHLADGNGNTPFVYLGRDRARATRVEPMIRRVTADVTDRVKALEIAYRLANAPSEDEERRIYRELTSLFVPESVESARNRLTTFVGMTDEYLDDHPEVVEDNRQRVISPTVPPERIQTTVEASFRRAGKDRRPVEVIEQELFDQKQQTAQHIASGERLSVCYDHWKQFKADKSVKHHDKYRKAWDEFVAFLKDKPIAALTKSDISNWQLHLKATKGTRGPKWFNDCLQAIRAIFDLCRRKTELPFPDGLAAWTDFRGDHLKYRPDPHNKKPMPKDVYDALLKKADEWAAIDVEEYAKTLPVDKTSNTIRLQRMNNTKQANRIKRDGMQFRAILRYAVQTSADNSDICLITWDNLKLSDPIPHVELPRHKTEDSTEPRYIPLLPSTIAALDDWRAFEKLHTPTIFRNDGKKRFTSSIVSKSFCRLRDAIPNGDDWDFKHIRNVAPNIGRDNRRPLEERDAILGHKPKGVTQEH